MPDKFPRIDFMKESKGEGGIGISWTTCYANWKYAISIRLVFVSIIIGLVEVKP